jgi:hypothetical protein
MPTATSSSAVTAKAVSEPWPRREPIGPRKWRRLQHHRVDEAEDVSRGADAD